MGLMFYKDDNRENKQVVEEAFFAVVRIHDTQPIGFSLLSSIWCESTAPTPYKMTG